MRVLSWQRGAGPWRRAGSARPPAGALRGRPLAGRAAALPCCAASHTARGPGWGATRNARATAPLTCTNATGWQVPRPRQLASLPHPYTHIHAHTCRWPAAARRTARWSNRMSSPHLRCNWMRCPAHWRCCRRRSWCSWRLSWPGCRSCCWWGPPWCRSPWTCGGGGNSGGVRRRPWQLVRCTGRRLHGGCVLWPQPGAGAHRAPRARGGF
jgi:hypothetical protein